MNNKEIGIINGFVFAVKSEKRISLRELVSVFEKVAKKKLNIKFGGKPYREREVMNPWQNGELIPRWYQKISIEEGIQICYKKNK